MPSYPQIIAELSYLDISDQNRTAVIIGGAQGIGASVTRLFGKIGCKKIIILGRNKMKGEEMVNELNEVGGPRGGKLEVVYIQGDVSEVEGMRKAVDDIKDVVGENEIDYLLFFQNGVPSGKMDLTSDGIEKAFSVQVISRFAISYLTIQKNLLKKDASIISIANTGQNLSDLDIEDLNLERRYVDGSRIGFALFRDQSARDSCVLDAFTLQFQARYPQYRFFHAFPGLVKTPNFTTEGLPWQVKLIFGIGMYTFATTGEKVAHMPVYMATHPEAFGDDRFFGQFINPVKPGAWAMDTENRSKCWEKLKHMIGE